MLSLYEIQYFTQDLDKDRRTRTVPGESCDAAAKAGIHYIIEEQHSSHKKILWKQFYPEVTVIFHPYKEELTSRFCSPNCDGVEETQKA